MKIATYSFGLGDRFGRQGEAQLDALIRARNRGCSIAPVWNKSSREHSIVGTSPRDVRIEADDAVHRGRWDAPYYVDADHISMGSVDAFLDDSDFFTLDVAEHIGSPADGDCVDAFLDGCRHLPRRLPLPSADVVLDLDPQRLRRTATKYLQAIRSAADLYRRIEQHKGTHRFITEVSMDETDTPQTPDELLLILKALADQGVPLQTIAPKFTGSFFKGIDYVGNLAAFESEFRSDLAVIQYAIDEFGLPENLKLSIHSGSDKFSLYPVMNKALSDFDAGLHLKTAGTTWLEELIGLALAGGDGLRIAVDVFTGAFRRMDELCKPYASVVDIDPAALPDPDEVCGWNGEEYADALRHDPACERYNPHLRQLLHVAYKVAADMGPRYLDALDAHRAIIAENVTRNLYERHIRPLFPGMS